MSEGTGRRSFSLVGAKGNFLTAGFLPFVEGAAFFKIVFLDAVFFFGVIFPAFFAVFVAIEVLLGCWMIGWFNAKFRLPQLWKIFTNLAMDFRHLFVTL
jgi:hypothetical protein